MTVTNYSIMSINSHGQLPPIGINPGRIFW